MIYPELRNIRSFDLEPPAMPDDPLECEVRFEITVGPKDQPGEDTFTFSVVTAAFLARYPGAQWGRGKLIVPSFDWQLVITAVARLLAECTRPTWAESAAVLALELVPAVLDDEPADA